VTSSASSSSFFGGRRRPLFGTTAAAAATALAAAAAATTTAGLFSKGASLCEEAKSGFMKSGKSERRNVAGGTSSGMPFQSVVLYQYDVCPFCNKVKAFLDYHNIPYDVVEVNPLTKTEIKQFEHEWKKVPVLVVDGKAMYNSRDIINDMDERARKNSGLTKRWFGDKSNKEKEKEEEWCKWVDERFVHVLTPNIYKTFREAMDSFDYITERGNFGFFERQSARIAGAVSMYGISKMVLKKRHGIEDERASLFEETRKWMSEGVGKSGGQFCGGDAPNIADISMFGVFRAVKTFQTFEDVCKEVPEMVPWYEKMKKAVGESSRSDGLSN
tara:strand:- start:946 stop:1932 length:987 start_codon:yes stop_codon:yes gene_type:complete